MLGIGTWLVFWLMKVHAALQCELTRVTIDLGVPDTADPLGELLGIPTGGIFGDMAAGPAAAAGVKPGSHSVDQITTAVYRLGTGGVSKIVLRTNGVEVTCEERVTGYSMRKVIGWER